METQASAPASASTSESAKPLIVEEDWSQYIVNAESESTTNAVHTNDHTEQNFSYYDTVLVPLSVGKENPLTRDRNSLEESRSQSESLVMTIRCMKALTPLDMLDLSNGLSDATGNRIWMGAVFFLECMVREISLPPREKAAQNGSHYQEQQQKHALANLRRTLFHKKKVLELGSGTGASLIAIGLVGSRKTNSFSLTDENAVSPSSLILTDNDTNVLSLCKMNCDRNLLRNTNHSFVDYTVGKLDWEDFYNGRNDYESPALKDSNDPFFLDSEHLKGTLDTVVATDVIYDVASIPLLMATAEGLLREGGFFVLAHVPRASIDCDLSMIRESLEELILKEADRVGLETDISKFDCCNHGGEQTKFSWEVLFGSDEKMDGMPPPKRASILRPGRMAQIWSEANKDVLRDDIPRNLQYNYKPIVLSVSSDYDYEELESCGASIMIFLKK